MTFLITCCFFPSVCILLLQQVTSCCLLTVSQQSAAEHKNILTNYMKGVNGYTHNHVQTYGKLYHVGVVVPACPWRYGIQSLGGRLALHTQPGLSPTQMGR